MHERIDLNGYWDWKLPGGMWQRRLVPSSYTCVGTATFQKELALNLPPGRRAFLCFDGIAYKGKVWCNDAYLGEMLPYVPYQFDVTDSIAGGHDPSPGFNRIRVDVEDITADYGPTGGWEDYGGITRDVYVELRDPLWIDDVQWLCSFNGDYTLARCRAIVTVGGHLADAGGTISLSLALSGREVYRSRRTVQGTGTSTQMDFEFTVENPLLWSPDSPVLYGLEVTCDAGGWRDVKAIHVGLREFKAVGSRFHLNGREIFLKGVARHEMWGDDQGFTLTPAQIEHDLRLIKNLGANFIRLVHYPHSKLTIELCDRLGLMVTEEPGLWWSDLTNEAITSKALQVMERTIRRDRSSPSVIAWLLFNECPFAGMPEYLTRGKQLCDRLDPGRLVSAANCLEPAQAKRVFDQAGMDFYTFHPYAYEPNLMAQGLEALRGKPCVFTEWGGWLIMGNANLMRWFRQAIVSYARARDPQPNLAGMAWWQWQDVFQFSRGLPGCVDGTLTDGLVDKYRNRKPMYDVMAGYFDAVDGPGDATLRPVTRLELFGPVVRGDESHSSRALDLTRHQDSPAQKATWEEVLSSLKVFHSSDQAHARPTCGPFLPQPVEELGGLNVNLSGRPLILAGEEKCVTLHCGFAACQLYFLGQTTFFDGYPLRGRLGEAIARYTIRYLGGESMVVDLRNGYEMSSASMIGRSSRIEPRAANVKRVCILHVDEDWEVYQVGCLEVQTDSAKIIDSIEFASTSAGFHPLLYGISAIV